MPDVVTVRRRWHHLRVDAEGITIGWWRQRDHIPWSEIGALAVDAPVSLLLLVSRVPDLVFLRKPCLHVCVLHEGKPRPAMAVRFPSRRSRKDRNMARETARVRSLLGEWIDVHQVPCYYGREVDRWWFDQPGARPLPHDRPRQPTVAERAAAVHGEVERLQAELDRLRREN